MTRDTDTLISGLVDELETVRPLRSSRGISLALAAIALGVLCGPAVFHLRVDVATGRPEPIFLISSGLFLLLGLACAAAVVVMGSPRVGPARNGWGWAAAMAGLLPLSAIVLTLVEGATAWRESAPEHGVMCVPFAILFGLATAGVLVAWLRHGAPTSPERAGLLTGMAAGCAGVFAVSFICPVDSVIHIGLWHGLAVPLCALAGRLIVPPLVRW